MQLYFDFIYNPVYDFTTAQVSLYQRLQKACIDKLKFEDNDKVLCVGVGTGNEILRILGKNGNVSIWGVDSSRRALNRAYRKALNRCSEIKVFRMDAHRLSFDDESFGKVLCIHLMGFLDDDRKATEEIFRVLKGGGQFAITYPSGNVGMKLATEIRRNIAHNLNSGEYGKAIRESLAGIGAAIVNIPITLFWEKPREGFYSYQDLTTMFAGLKLKDYQIEEDSVYQDLIVFGTK